MMASNIKKSRKVTSSSNATTTGTSSSANSDDNENGCGGEGGDGFEPGSWECTVCTFRNKYEAFKCLICDTRKGTSTRKPRLNPTVVQQQTLVQKMAVEVELKQQKKQRTSSEARNSPDLFAPSGASCGTPPASANGSSSLATTPTMIGTKILMGNKNDGQNPKLMPKRKPIPFQDALVVRSSAKKTLVTVDGKTFTIVEFKPRISPRGRKKGSVNSNSSTPTKAIQMAAGNITNNGAPPTANPFGVPQ